MSESVEGEVAMTWVFAKVEDHCAHGPATHVGLD